MADVIVSLAPITALGSPLLVRSRNPPLMRSSIAIPLETPIAICKIFSTNPVGSVGIQPSPVLIPVPPLHESSAGPPGVGVAPDGGVGVTPPGGVGVVEVG